jgi:hypothetical protein
MTTLFDARKYGGKNVKCYLGGGDAGGYVGNEKDFKVVRSSLAGKNPKNYARKRRKR